MKNSKILVKKDRIISVSVPVYFIKFKSDEKTIFAECPSLAITTYGDNLKHAKTMFDDAFYLWLKTVNDDGNILAVLKDLGWKITKNTVAPKEDYFNVPVDLIAGKSVNLQIGL